MLWLDRRQALDCPDPEAASGVRTYSLRKSWWMSYFRYFQRLRQLMVLYLLPLW